jgi:hypothetical protein
MTHRRGSSISTATIQAVNSFLNRIAVPSYDLPTKMFLEVLTAELLTAKKHNNSSNTYDKVSITVTAFRHSIASYTVVSCSSKLSNGIVMNRSIRKFARLFSYEI